MRNIKTIDYYNKNADEFIENTLHADMHDAQDKFLAFMNKGSLILDFGCGSGRDTEYFMKKGFRVEATDGSARLCKMTSARLGITVKQMLFQELSTLDYYDGIWACSSILHLAKTELDDVLRKMAAALHSDGVIYTSFKYGLFEGERNGRLFTDFTEASFEEFICRIPELGIIEQWITEDVRPEKHDEKWLNLLLKKRM